MKTRWLIIATMAATFTATPRFSAADAPANLKPLDFEVRVRAPLTQVWDAWTTNAGLEKWFAPKANVELRSGGPFEILFMPDAPPGQRGAEGLKVIHYLPRELLAFEWNAPPQFPRARAQRTWVIVRLTDLGDGTVRVRLSQDGFSEKVAQHPEEREEWEKTRDYFSKAWPQVLAQLQKHFNKSADADGPQVTEGVVEAPVADVWKAFATKEGWESWNVAHCEMDLKVGGKILSHYDSKGAIGDPNTIENVILAYEPNRMLTIRIGKPPERFPFKEAARNVWHVISFEEAGPGRTRLRVTGLGYGNDDESKQMRKFFEAGNTATIKKLQAYFADKSVK